ncbi:hypothetical protein QE152_g9842 [Popillia japonica]|uniref:Uncharacterized protein n=1 Tax=Popillia japonica TaxID=7064 RepID=A0AAW1LWM3_POPJA
MFEKISTFEFRRSVSQGMMIRGIDKGNRKSGTIPKRRKYNYSIADDIRLGIRGIDKGNRKSGTIPKRRKYNYSIADDIRLGYLGKYWVIYEKTRGRCEMCSAKAIQSGIFG